METGQTFLLKCPKIGQYVTSPFSWRFATCAPNQKLGVLTLSRFTSF